MTEGSNPPPPTACSARKTISTKTFGARPHSSDDTVKVTDFGTAKILQFGTVQQTQHVMGTPSYMSPEQIKGKVVDGRSDIFSLGVVLYEMVTGRAPFSGDTTA